MKLIRMLSVLVVLGLLVAACGPTAPAAQPTTAPVATTAPQATQPPAMAECMDELGCVDIAAGAPIRIAYMLVVAGADASLGIDSRRGIEIAIEDKKEVMGHPIELIGEDSGCNAEGGQAAATKLAADKTIVAVIGSSCSSEARPGAPIISQAGLTMVSPSNTAPDLTDPASHQAGYMRTAHNDKVQGAVVAQFALEKLGVKTAATIHDGSPYAEGLQGVMADEFKAGGGTITSQSAVAPTDTDMGPVLTNIAADSPELLYYPIFTAAGGFVTRQAKEVSGLEDAVLMGSDGMFSPDFLKAAGDAAEGMYLSSPDFSAFGSGYQQFLEKHQAKYSEAPISAFHAHAYDAANLIFAAIEKVAKQNADGTLSIGRKALRDAMFATKDLQGLTGNLTCDANGDCADPAIAVYQVTAENISEGVMPSQPYWKPGQ